MNEIILRQHRCCFTGHRPEKLHITPPEAIAWLEEKIYDAISRWLHDFYHRDGHGGRYLG